MIAADARTAVKDRLDIDSSDATFNTKIDGFVLAAVNRLYPIAQAELPRIEQSITVDSYGEAVVDMAALGITAARMVEISSGYEYDSHSDYYHHGTTLYIRDLTRSTTRARIYGNTPFTLATVPTYLEQAVYWFAMSEFYDFMAGSKKNYNIYMSSGARDVDNMRDESQYYEQKANVYINDRAKLSGIS